MKSQKLNVVDLFAGCGAISTGFQHANNNPYNIVLANEWDKNTAECFKLNHPKTKIIAHDIKKLTKAQVWDEAQIKNNEIDLVVGGPPCQGFSAVGKREFDDERNKYFKEFIRVVNDLSPDVVIMENVPQFLSFANGFFFNSLKLSLSKLDYNTKASVLLASDYGIPQVRQRVFVICVKKDFFNDEITFPFPTHERIANTTELLKGDLRNYEKNLKNSKLKKFVSVEDAIEDLPPLTEEKPIDAKYAQKPFSEFQKMRRRNSKKVYNHELWHHRKELLDYISKIPEGGRMIETYPKEKWKGKGFSQAYARLHRKGIGHTITTFVHNPGSGRFIHYRDHRAISIREAARLQSFDDDFIFCGSKTQQEQQVGNAVPPILAQKIAEHVYGMIFAKNNIVGIKENLKISLLHH